MFLIGQSVCGVRGRKSFLKSFSFFRPPTTATTEEEKKEILEKHIQRLKRETWSLTHSFAFSHTEKNISSPATTTAELGECCANGKAESVWRGKKAKIKIEINWHGERRKANFRQISTFFFSFRSTLAFSALLRVVFLRSVWAHTRKWMEWWMRSRWRNEKFFQKKKVSAARNMKAKISVRWEATTM